MKPFLGGSVHYLLIYDVAPDYLTLRAAHRDEHLRLAWEAHARGELLLGGALAEPVDTAMLLFRGDSPEAAEHFAAADPYVRHGVVIRWRVRPWTTVVGAEAATPVHPEGVDQLLRLGFIGTGNIASAVVEGFCTAEAPCRIWVSPRNEGKTRRLAERFPQVTRAASNQEVLDRSDVVFIALRPTVAPEVLKALSFRTDQTVVSLIPLIPRDTMAALVHPAQRVFKALPLPYVARHLGEIPYFPKDQDIEPLLKRLCQPIPMPNERELHLLWAITGLISLFYSLMQATQAWCVEGGADPEDARRYTASMYASLARMAESGEMDFQALASEAATPGGLNEMALRMMKEGTMFPDFHRVLDAILARFGEAPVGGTKEA